MTRRPLSVTVAAVLVGVVATWGAPAAGQEAPSIDTVVVSSTVWHEGAVGPFTMTVTNRGATTETVSLPAPVAGAEAVVDAGSWDGQRWIVDVAAGATVTMHGGTGS